MVLESEAGCHKPEEPDLGRKVLSFEPMSADLVLET